MKRLLLHFIVALLTFIVGGSLAAWRDAYNVRVRSEQEAKRTDAERPLTYDLYSADTQEVVPVSPRSFAAELEDIDKVFKRRCSVPGEAESYGSHHAEESFKAFKALQKLSDCTDKWATARHNAINQQRAKFLITY